MEAPGFYELVSQGESARVVRADARACEVDLWGVRSLSLALTFPQEEIQPMFSGACWAGTVVWPASLLLCDEMRAGPPLQGANVIELGAGVGVPGMAAKVLGAGKVFLTEQDPLPELLERNVRDNFPPASTEGTAPLVRTLDWYEPGDELEGQDFDLILVSDCVYKELYGDSWRPLADVIKRLSRPGRTRTLNSIERRNEDGVDEFLAYASEIGISWRVLRRVEGPENEKLELYEMTVAAAE